jgi:hypothetical protein
MSRNRAALDRTWESSLRKLAGFRLQFKVTPQIFRDRCCLFIGHPVAFGDNGLPAHGDLKVRGRRAAKLATFSIAERTRVLSGY